MVLSMSYLHQQKTGFVNNLLVQGWKGVCKGFLKGLRPMIAATIRRDIYDSAKASVRPSPLISGLDLILHTLCKCSLLPT
jgi:hypothetical protein